MKIRIYNGYGINKYGYTGIKIDFYGFTLFEVGGYIVKGPSAFFSIIIMNVGLCFHPARREK